MFDNTVIVHFHSQHSNYFDMSIWKWRDGKMGKDAYFSRFDSFGAVANLQFPAHFTLSYAYLIIKNKDWSFKTKDFKVNRNSNPIKTEVWIVEGDETLYYSRQAAVASKYYSRFDSTAFDMAVNSKTFDKKWGFDGWLGFSYSENETQFRLWAPRAERVELLFYHSTNEEASISQVIPMARGDQYTPENHKTNTHGVWSINISGDINYQAYAYRVYHRKRTFIESRDPYAIATTANGRRSVVIDKSHLIPEGFSIKHGKEANWRLSNPNKAVIYEMQVRDFSKSKSSGVSPENRGKYLGAIEEGTRNEFGDVTCFDYVKDLGITHIQLQPVFDHHQILTEHGDYAYNWGYDPENYNVPDATFSSNPHEPATRILELKQLVQAYHDAGIGVIMDVVYNHTYSNIDSAFQLIVPDYYYRMNPDGSFQNGTGVGNETASEKEMFRKYMIDSLKYWVNEYNIDGFRFDLMGIHDVETMNLIRQEMDKIDPNILLYGEGWDMGVGLRPEDKAKKDNAWKMPRIGFFNDDQRNAIKGAEVFGELKVGFVSGASTESIVAKAILGSDELCSYQTPSQVLNYVEAHDNYNLNDLLWELHPNDSNQDHQKRVELATGMNLLMQGMSFMELGQEFLRTKCYPTGKNGHLTHEDKERAMNSYNAPDLVNQVDWNNVTTYQSSVDFVKNVIEIKSKTNLFSIEDYQTIRERVYIESAKEGSGIISWKIFDGDNTHFHFTIDGKNMKINMTAEVEYDIMNSKIKRLHKQGSTLENESTLILERKNNPM
ncbi:pullulanase, type I [Streptococcus urinalis FB127-CNA-2]|uniref:pullulanase n=1 Tax=Streptococcus urinalis 2285-97 TaxID=764291 RepID=G5KF01_9STRE|nr:type I pullulanase [Streptococcus urinalis]EHJ57604.1 pullulanase, type I [Streptococcus urinalis 2285-97]EKS21968.1 pullulanase, type I [Streptococcus urinalis FB127-CNA-2]VEF31780.1 glycogen debranching protein [Streptococcus urinalis]